LTLGAFTIGFLGPAVFELSLSDSLAVIWCVGFLGSACAGYIAVFGKRHGLRTLANSRYTFGWYGAMVMSLLNVVTEGVFSVSNAILGAQTIHTLSKNTVPDWAGVIILSVVSWFLAFAGFRYIHYYNRCVEKTGDPVQLGPVQ
jgi:purine-cytosine permease-like protein